MADLTEKEIQAIHDAVYADIEKNGIPSDDELMAEVEAMNQPVKKSSLAEVLGLKG